MLSTDGRICVRAAGYLVILLSKIIKRIVDRNTVSCQKGVFTGTIATSASKVQEARLSRKKGLADSAYNDSQSAWQHPCMFKACGRYVLYSGMRKCSARHHEDLGHDSVHFESFTLNHFIHFKSTVGWSFFAY